MTQNNVLKDYDTLPPEAQKQVIDFIAFLQTRYQAKPIKKTKPKVKLSGESFIGIWRNREEMRDSSAWLRKVRTAEWE